MANRKIDGLKLDELIARQGMNGNQFSKICGISPQTLANMIIHNKATMLHLVKVADALNITIKDLLVL